MLSILQRIPHIAAQPFKKQRMKQPVHSVESPVPAASDLGLNMAQPLQVLVVEDAPDMRATVHATIEMLGHAVVSVPSAEAALAEIENIKQLDVLMTDISLLGQSGLELAALCVAAHPRVQVIFASGYGEVSEHLGVDGWSLPKPYSADDLRLLLEQVSAASRASPPSS